MKATIAKPPQEKSIGEACLVSITSSTKTQPNGRISWPTFLKEASSFLGCLIFKAAEYPEIQINSIGTILDTS